MSPSPVLARALAYPFNPPRHSFVFVAGQGYKLVKSGPDLFADAHVERDGSHVHLGQTLAELGAGETDGMERRTPVVGYGSNASAVRLAEKFGHGPDQVIPVLRCRLHDHDVVYATHFASYGSLPAAVYASAGTVAEVSVSFLTDHQLDVMHASEGDNYRFGELDAAIEVEGLGVLERPSSYITVHGVCGLDGAPTALAAVEAVNRRFAALDQNMALERACRALGGTDLDVFVSAMVADKEHRLAMCKALRRHAIAHGT
jgi:hypothetical protein